MLRTDDPDEQDNAMVHQLFLHMLGPVLVSWLVSEMSLACQYGVSSNTEQDRTRVCRYLWDRFIVCSCPGRRYPALGKMVKSWLSWIRIWCNSLGSNSAFSAQYSISIFWSEGNKKALGSSQIHDNRERERDKDKSPLERQYMARVKTVARKSYLVCSMVTLTKLAKSDQCYVYSRLIIFIVTIIFWTQTIHTLHQAQLNSEYYANGANIFDCSSFV